MVKILLLLILAKLPFCKYVMFSVNKCWFFIHFSAHLVNTKNYIYRKISHELWIFFPIATSNLSIKKSMRFSFKWWSHLKFFYAKCFSPNSYLISWEECVDTETKLPVELTTEMLVTKLASREIRPCTVILKVKISICFKHACSHFKCKFNRML